MNKKTSRDGEMKMRSKTLLSILLLALFVIAGSANAADQKTFGTPAEAAQAPAAPASELPVVYDAKPAVPSEPATCRRQSRWRARRGEPRSVAGDSG